MKNYDEEKQYSKKTIIKALSKAISITKSKYTVLSVAVPRERRDLRKLWIPALKSTLELGKRRLSLEYIVLFEKSDTGYSHAHVVVLAKGFNKFTFKKISRADLEDLRRYFLLLLYRKVFKKSVNFGLSKPLDEFAQGLKLDPTKVVYLVKGFFSENKKYIPAGHGVGFLTYLSVKPELLGKETTISSGLLQLRNKKIDRLANKLKKKHL